MLRYTNKGYTVEIDLPSNKGRGDNGYAVECRYKYDKESEKYLLSMWLRRKDIDDKFKIEYQKIDTQLISATRDTILEYICRIIEQADSKGYFDYYIERFEYTYKCFDHGNDFFERESLDHAC